jgi:hypothetical protein
MNNKTDNLRMDISDREEVEMKCKGRAEHDSQPRLYYVIVIISMGHHGG